MSTQSIRLDSQARIQPDSSSHPVQDRYPYTSFITTIFLGAIMAFGGLYLARFSHMSGASLIGNTIALWGMYLMALGGIKCTFNRTLTPDRKPQREHINHWIFHVVPPSWESISWYQFWKLPGWLFCGNDHDGPMGTERSSGRRWIEKWGGQIDASGNIIEKGEISLKRFLAWQLRNPGHNLTFFGLGAAGWKNPPMNRIALISSTTFKFCGRQPRKTMFPMDKHTGIYFGLNPLPGFSFRIFIPKTDRALEGYVGGRTRGQVGIALRLKKESMIT